MSCCDARSRLSALLDGALDAAERDAVARMASACRQCRAELEAFAETDAALRAALAAAAEAAPPPGYHDDFWGRLAARLDVDVAGGEDMHMSSGPGNEKDKDRPTTDVAGKPIMNREEISGLHDIKALATSTIEKQRARRQTEPPSEVAEALLATASPAALGNVVLPTPGKEVAPRAVAAPVMATATAADAPLPGARRSRAPLFALVGVLVAGVGAGAYIIGTRGGAERAAAPGAAPTAEQPQLALAPEAARSGADPTGAAAPAPAPTPAPEAPPAVTAPAEPEASPPAEGTAQDEGKPRDVEARRSEKKDKDEGKLAAKGKEPKDATVASPKSPPADEKAGGGAGGGKITDAPKSEIDDIFAGGGAAAEEKKPDAQKPALPEKLSQNDVKSGMGSVRARVQACYDKYKVPGKITLKVRIDPDGTVGSADVVEEKFKGTETGACVSAAVGTAKFPPVSGPALTVSYPFILQ